MDLIKEKVEHISFGEGIILEVKDDKVYVGFQNQENTKAFKFPEAFEKYLKVQNPVLEKGILEELKAKKALLEEERLEKEESEAKLRPEVPVKKTAVRKKKA